MLSSKIDSDARLSWARRGKVDKIIVVDWFTEKIPLPQPISVLIDSMMQVWLTCLIFLLLMT